MNFPEPVDRKRGRNFWDEDHLDEWDAARAGRDLTAEVAAARERFKRADPDAAGDQGEVE